jgi:hypothetical protein
MLLPAGAFACVLVACAPHTAPNVAPAPEEPLRVFLHTPAVNDLRYNTLTFDLNRPAYLAVFEVLPDQGIRLLYPWYGQPGERLAQGYSVIHTTPAALGEYLNYPVSAAYSFTQPALPLHRRLRDAARHEPRPGTGLAPLVLRARALHVLAGVPHDG